MATFSKMMQISPLGSKDPENRALQTSLQGWGSGDIQTLEGHFQDWDNSPNHPIVQNFQNLFSDPKVATQFDHPGMQNFLFDVDNSVKGSAGVFREPQQGLSHFGVDIDGKPLYGFDDMRNSQEWDLGKNRLYNLGTVMQQLGTFSDPEDSDRFAKLTNISSDPNFMGRIEGLQNQGNTRGAVNAILTEFGHPDLDSIEGSDDPKRSYGLAFAAYNYLQNAEKFSPAQKSLALSSMGMTGYKFKDGTDLYSRPLILDEGGVAFTVGDAIGLAGTGVDVFSLQKNWDQIDAVQRLTFGKGTPAQMASTGRRIGLLGDPAMGGASVAQTDADLGHAGFTSVPSAGIGAITGSGEALPDSYEVIGSGEKPGQVIAVPKGLSFSTATINGANEVRSLNTAPGVRKAGMGAFKVQSNWLPVSQQVVNARGTSFSSGLGQSGMLQDPYLSSAMAVTSVYGNTVQAKPKNFAEGLAFGFQSKEKLKEAKTSPVKAGAGAAVAAGALGSFGGGAGVLLSTGEIIAAGSAIPAGATAVGSAALPATGILGALGPVGVAAIVGGAILYKTGALEKLSDAFGGKSEEQTARDDGRKLFKDITDGNWQVTLSDGGTADIGTDGHGGQHEFRFPDKDPHKIGRSLNAYDVDYTNNLDFSANMMTSALTRLVAGGKGTSLDQVAGQLANASLGKVGFGKDMTEENFSYVRDNVRGWFFKKGIQTKEDAYALMNQAFSSGRIAEMDQVAMQQGINMVFDENGYDTANVLLSGRDKGIQVAGDIPKAPGPNFDSHMTPVERLNPDNLENFQEPIEFQSTFKFNAGTYGGPEDTSSFTRSIVRYNEEKARGVESRKQSLRRSA